MYSPTCIAACPSRDELAAFAQGNLPLEALEAIADHLGSCERCEAAVKQDASDGDALVSSLRRLADANPDAESDLEPEMAALMASGFRESRPRPADVAQPTQLREYQLLESLGEGGMGAVYRALHTRLDKVVALKTLASWRLNKPDAVARFHREMKVVGKLSHPNIVQATDAGEVEGTHFLVMEFVDGLDLSKLVKRIGPLPVSDACELVRQAALGLDYVHQSGLVHRDVKPSNLLLSRTGQVKVLDLGLARLGETVAPDNCSTASSMVMGSFDYLAPEQANDPHAVDPRADLYSLGCTLYHLLVGEPPFPAPKHRTVLQKLRAHETAAPPRLEDRRPDAPPELAKIIEQLLAKNPADRFASAEELAAALAPLSLGSNLQRLLLEPELREPEVIDTAPPMAKTLVTVRPPKPNDGQGGQRVRRIWLLAGGAVLAALGLMTIAIRTDEGTIEIASEDREVRVVVERGGEQITLIDLATNQEVELRSGKYHLRLEGRDDLELVASDFDLKRGDRVVATIRRRVANRGALDPALAELEMREAAADALRRENIPAAMLAAAGGGDAQKAPQELVGIFGRRMFLCGLSQSDVCFSPDGRRLACSLSKDRNSPIPGGIKVFDAATGEELISLTGHPAGVAAVRYRPDGAVLASCSSKEVAFWDAQSGEKIRALTGFDHTVSSIAFSPDGRRLAAGGGTYRKAAELTVWDLDAGEKLFALPGHTDVVVSVRFSADGKKLASAGWDGRVKVWNAETGELLRAFRLGSWANAVAFSPDGAKLAAASYDGRVHVWDLNTGEMEHTLRYSWCVTDVAYSSNGKYLATGCFDQRVRVYEAQSMEHLATFDGHCARVDRVSFSPDSRYLAIAGLRNNLQVWDVEARTWQFPPPHQSEAAAAVVSGDEEFLISGGADERIRFWDLATAKELRTLIDDDYFKGGQSPIRALAHERGASLLVSGHANGLAKVWELPEGALRHKLVCSSKAGVLALALDRRGEILATADADGVVKLWNPQTGVHLHTLGGHAAPVHGLALSEDGRTLASGSADGMIRLWDADTGDELRTLSNNRLPVRGLAFVAGDQWLAIASDAALKLCDAVSGEERHIFRSHRGIVDMAYHPTRWMLAACGWEDRTIQLYDLRQNPPQQRLLSPYPSGLRVESLAFTPEGRYLITGNSDGTLFALQLAPPPKDSAE